MFTRTRWLPSMVLVMVFVVGAVLGTPDRAWGIGFVLGQSKEELKLKYDVVVEEHFFAEAPTGRVTVVFTLADEGRLKPLDEVQFVIPQRKKNNDRRYRMDLVVSIEMKETDDGRRVGRVHILNDLAERAQIRLNTHTMDGKTDPLTRLHHVIPIANYMKNAPAAAPEAKPEPASAADEKDARDNSAGHLQWVGHWEVSADVNRILGFADAESRAFATWVHPTSFRLSFDKKIDKKIGEWIGQMPDTFRDQFFKPNGHEIVATGKWETKFVEEQDLGTNCFVTHQGGATFLWCEAPYVGWFPLRVALIQGKTRDRDILVIDFNSFHDRLAGGQESQDTVAYKRSKEKQRGADAADGRQETPATTCSIRRRTNAGGEPRGALPLLSAVDDRVQWLGDNSVAVNDNGNKDAIGSFSSIHNVDGWSREELAQKGISIAPWKHELQTENPPRNWIQVSFARAHVPRSQDCLMTVHFVSDEGVLEGASRAVWDESEKDALRLRFMVGNRYRGRSNDSNVEIVMWTEKSDGDGKHAVGYHLSLRRIIELAEAR